jgi:hypothetical protein
MMLRNKREQAAGKLLHKVPELTSLSLEIREIGSSSGKSETQYIRRVPLEHAHALFEMPCSYSSCTDGGYDATREILDALASHAPRFEGEHTCRGSCGASACTRVLRYVATATYRTQPEV